ncbi:MAG: hypothetical protein WBE76_21295 [Terracidiphilus sp.]
MAVGPIPDLRPLTAIQPDVSIPELRAVVRIENSSRSGNSTSGRKQSAGRQDDSFDDSAADSEPEVANPGVDDLPKNQINLFA